MQLSKRKRRWISVGVGVVGLVTIVGLSDLLFLLPSQTAPVSVSQPVPDTLTTSTTATDTTTSTVTVPKNIPSAQPATDTIDFKL